MTTPVALGQRAARHSVVGLVAIIGVCVAMPTVLAAVTGNLAIPHNDAWAYSLITERFAKTGAIRLVGWNHPFSVGQVVALGPLGSSIVTQQLFVAVVAMAALGATFVLLSTAMSPARALFGVAVVGAFPGLGLLSTSFMGDVPTYCTIILTLLIGRGAIERRSSTGLALAVAIGVWGFTIRESAIAASACVLICAFVTWTDSQKRRQVVALAGLSMTVAVALLAWRRSLANGQPPVLVVHPKAGAIVCADAWFTLGLLLLPATAATLRPSSWSAPARWAAVITAGVGAVPLARLHGLLLGNYLDAHGAYSIVLLGTRHVLPSPVWGPLQVGAWVGGTLLSGELVDGFRRLDLSVRWFAALTALGTSVVAMLGEPTFDRFLLPLSPVGLIMILGGANRRAIPGVRAIAASGLLVALLAVSLTITMNGLAFDSTRWRAAESLVHGGVSPSDIDAGLEWVGYHYPGPAVNARPTKEREGLPWYAQTLFPSAGECYVLTSSPITGLGQIVRSVAYRTYLTFGHSQLIVYDTGRCHPTSAKRRE